MGNVVIFIAGLLGFGLLVSIVGAIDPHTKKTGELRKPVANFFALIIIIFIGYGFVAGLITGGRSSPDEEYYRRD